MRLSRIACTLGAMLVAIPALAGSFLVKGTATPAIALVGQQVTFSFPVAYLNHEKFACGLQVDFGDGSAPRIDTVQQSMYPATYSVQHVYAKSSAGQPYGGIFFATLTPNSHPGLVGCLGNGTVATVTVNAPVNLTSDIVKGTTPPVVSSAAAPNASVMVVISSNVENVAGTYGMSVKLKGQIKSSPIGSLTGFKMSFEVDGKPVGTAVSDPDGRGSVDLPVTDAMTVGAHPIKLVAQGPDGKSYHSEATLDIVKTETKLYFSLGYPTSSKVVEQETAITFKGQLKRITDSGDTGPEGRKVTLLLDGKGIGNATTDAAGRYNHVYTIPKTMATTEHIVEVAFEGDTHYLATAAPNKETFTVKNKPRLPPNVINTPEIKGSGIY
nr:hypothetical protein [Rhodoferax sp.]